MNKLKNIEYAIVDIETTGGNASNSRITEIAIIIHDGTTIVSRWERLVQPEQNIPLAIFALTGINNELVADAPTFGAIAAEVFDLLNGRVFVAHNVNFDYSFVKHQLAAAGFIWSARKLCTVRLSRKIMPGMASYSLGRLCNQIGIAIENRHRAGGDAAATAILFDKLLHMDESNVLQSMLKKTAVDQRLPPNLLPEIYEALPDKAGVYYFHNQQGKVIYVGKAINIKKRVATHFSGHSINPQRQHFLKDIFDISFELCATELMALILECAEIKRLWPIYNRALKKFEPKFGLSIYEAVNGYQYVTISRLAKTQLCIQTFNTLHEGNNVLRKFLDSGKIDARFCKFAQQYSKKEIVIDDEAYSWPDAATHNNNVQILLQEYLAQRLTYVIIDKGRHATEKSCIWVEQGSFYGMGYIDDTTQLNDWLAIKSSLQRYPSNNYMMQLIQFFVNNNPNKVTYMDADIAIINNIQHHKIMKHASLQASLF